MANNLTREEHLQALAEAAHQYVDDKQSETINILTEAFQVAGGNSYVLPIAGGSLPVAGTSTLGCIKVGAGLSMAGDTLNVTLESDSYTLPTASENVKGGVKIGTGLQMQGDTLNCTIDSGETYSEATTLTAGLMSATDKAKLDNIAANANNYTLPTASTSTKGGVKVGTGLEMQGDTLSVTLQSGETYDTFTGATGLAGGASGLVPAPSAGDNEKFLRGDGQWTTVQSGETYSEATTLTSGLMSASDKTKLNGIADNANYYTLPTASTSTKGGIKPGTGLVMNGDTLNCTVTGSSGGGGTAITLSNTASTVNGAMWLDSTVASTAGDAITLSTIMPATVVNGSMWLAV